MNRQKRWSCFALAVILLLETCGGEMMPRAERNMTTGFGMNVNKVYAASDTKDPAKTVTPPAMQTKEPVAADGVDTVTPPETKSPAATDGVQKTAPPETKSPAEADGVQKTTPPAVQTPAATEEARITTSPATQSPVTPAPSQPGDTAVPQPTESIDLKPETVQKIYFCGRGRHKVMVSWKASEKASYYLVYRKVAGNGKYTQRARVKTVKYLDHSLQYGKNYKYKVIAVNDLDGIRKSGAVTAVYYNKTIVSTDHQKYSYEEMKGDIETLQKKYHGIANAEVIGKSEDGRNIYDVVVGNKKAAKTLLVVANLHAREYMTSQLCMDQIEYYLENYYKNNAGGSWKKTFDRIAVHYIPMANPDGTTISQYGIQGIRSASLRKKLYKMNHGADTTIWKSNARGVDLNRNYPVRFRHQGKRGNMGYSGPKACSESETRAIKGLTDRLKSRHNLQGVVSYHAMGSIIFGGSGLGGKLQKNTDKLYYQTRRLTGYASAASYHSSSGGDGNYLTYIQNIKHVPGITLEIGRITCPGPAWEYPSIWNKNKMVVLQAAKLFAR